MAQRKFVYAPDMEELGRRVGQVKEIAAKCEDMFEAMREVDDWKIRFEVLVVAIQDHTRGIIDKNELELKCRYALEGVEDDVHPEVVVSWMTT